MTLDPKRPAEIVPVTFEFKRLTSAPLTPALGVSQVSGPTDASVASMIVGSPQIIGSKVVQKVGAGVDGAIYQLTCQVDTAEGYRYVLVDKLEVTTRELT